MAKASENKNPPFKGFIDDYEDLLQKMHKSTSQFEVTKLTKEIHHTLQQLFKSMMSFYEQQHQKNLQYIEDNKNHLEKISQKAVARSQSMFERSLKESQAMMDKQMNYLKQVYGLQPKELLDSALEHANKTFSEQSKIWQELYNQQKEDIHEDLQTFELEAKKMLKQSETLRQDMLTLFHDLEERFHEVLAKKQSEKESKH